MLNKRIRQVRIDNDMNMVKFAERLGVTQGTVSMWESGNRNISNQTIKLISREFNVSEEWLTDGTGEMYLPATKAMRAASVADGYIHKNSDIKNRLIDVISEMDEERLKLMIQEAKKIISELGKDQD